MRNSNISKYEVILTSSNNVIRSKNKKRNCDAIKTCQNDEQKQNLAATLF